MLAKFAVTNYRNFKNRIEWDLTSHNDYAFNEYAIKNDTIKNGILYGPNGCGKSNMGLAIFDIVNHMTQKWKKGNYYENFCSAGHSQTPVIFEYTFNFSPDIIEYTYSKDAAGNLIKEKLTVNNNLVFDKDTKLRINANEFSMVKSIVKQLENNANAISVVNYLLSSYPLPKNHYLLKLKNFVDGMLWFKCLETREFIGLETSLCYLNEFIISNHLLSDFSTFLKETSNQTYLFPEKYNTGKDLICEIDNTPVEFDKIASTGTESLKLLYVWLKKMGRASFVFIDEFDAFYHFRLSFNVCKTLFKQDAQIFTSSHNTFLMTNDLLRPDCNFLLNNNIIRPLSKCTNKELRQANNIEKLFRGGNFIL